MWLSYSFLRKRRFGGPTPTRRSLCGPRLAIILPLICCAVQAAEPVAEARKLLASGSPDLARSEKVLGELAVNPNQPGWEERAFLFAELALKTNRQAFEKQAKQSFSLLSDKASSPWNHRGAIGLIRLGVKDEGSRTAAINKLDELASRLSKDDDQAAVDAAYALGLLLKESGSPQRMAIAFEHARKMLAHIKSYYGKNAYTGLVTEGHLKIKSTVKKPKVVRKRPPARKRKPPEEPMATFKRARSEQGARRYEKAIGLFERVKEGWPEHELAQASDYYEEECRIGLDQVTLAEANLGIFIKADTDGPWRGHANLLLGNLALDRRFDPGEATPYFKAIVDGAAKSHKTWQAVLADAHERYGLLAYFREQYDMADRHLAAYVRLQPLWPKQPNAPVGMAELREAVQAKTYPLPDDLRKNGHEQTRFVLFLATAYMNGWKDAKGYALFRRVADGGFKGANFEQRAYALCMSARCQMRMDNKDKASEICDLFLKPPWNQSRTYASRALAMRGNIASARADNKTAVKYLKMVYTAYPNTESARWSFLGTIFHLSFEERPEKTLERLKEYKRRWPKSVDDDRVDKAIDRCQKAIAQGVTMPVAKYYLQLMDQGQIQVEEE